MRKAWIRGGMFLLIIVALTYYGKWKKPSQNIVSKHGLAGWIFPDSNLYSLFLVLPNDGDDSNGEADGDRLYFYPRQSPGFLDTNHVRYNQKNLYLLGRVEREKIKEYCPQVDSSSFLYYTGDSNWKSDCKQAFPLALISGRLSHDWSISTRYQSDSTGDNFSLVLAHLGRTLMVSNEPCQSEGARDLICLQLKGGEVPLTDHSLHLGPGFAFHKGVFDSSLVISQGGQAISFYMEPDGVLRVKKIWLPEIIPEKMPKKYW